MKQHYHGFKYKGDTIISSSEKGFALAELINRQKTLLILDGLEPLQHPVGTKRSELKDHGTRQLITFLWQGIFKSNSCLKPYSCV